MIDNLSIKYIIKCFLYYVPSFLPCSVTPRTCYEDHSVVANRLIIQATECRLRRPGLGKARTGREGTVWVQMMHFASWYAYAEYHYHDTVKLEGLFKLFAD